MRAKLKSKGQVLGTVLIMGAVILIFALAMVTMLSSTIKLRVKANSGNYGILGADASVDKAMETLKQGNNWGVPPSLSFTPIPGYNSDTVYTDIPNTQYLVQISPGNLLNPPGDPAYERTVSVDLYSLPVGMATPVAQPTPWTQPGVSAPLSFTNHRALQVVVKRGSFNASIVAGGSIATNGNFIIYWGNVYDYFQDPTCTGAPVVDGGQPCTTVTTISLPHNQPLGPGYPSFHTLYGCIGTKSASCGGCSGGGGSTNPSVCTGSEPGAQTCGLYPNDPNMPPRPKTDIPGMRYKAKQIYKPKSGMAGNPCSSGESGYFWSTTCGPCSIGLSGPQTDSVADSVTCNGVVPTGLTTAEGNHQFNGSGSFTYNQIIAVQARMQQNLGISGVWLGNDDLVYFVDSLDGGDRMTGSNSVGSIKFTNFPGFWGTFVLMGDFDEEGHNGTSIGTVNAPSGTWCPANASLSPEFDGFLYIAGNYTGHGSPQYYGSIDLEGTFSASGTPSLYYRGNFNYNLVESGSLVKENWKEIPTSAFPPHL